MYPMYLRLKSSDSRLSHDPVGSRENPVWSRWVPSGSTMVPLGPIRAHQGPVWWYGPARARQGPVGSWGPVGYPHGTSGTRMVPLWGTSRSRMVLLSPVRARQGSL